MEQKLAIIIKTLTDNGDTLATMESCTGGGLANAITSIEGASEVIKFSAVTYSNEYKIKMGVSQKTIDTYSVYSAVVAQEMSKAISDFANSRYGIGITGKLNRIDKYNLNGDMNTVFVSIYDKIDNKYYPLIVKVNKDSRVKNKEMVINHIIDLLLDIIP